MNFRELSLKGAWLIEPQKLEDERGFFARVFCIEEFRLHGLKANLVQCNISQNQRQGTLRGLHYQAPPHAEVKTVRCTRGAIFDCIVDLRPNSPTYLEWVGVELSDENRCILYVPEGFAHGYQSLTDDSEVFYQTTAAYCKEAERGLRYDDPAIKIRWPLAISAISEKDRGIPCMC